jgi:CHAD domain-containing protein
MGADAILYDYLWSQIDEIFAGDAGLPVDSKATRRVKYYKEVQTVLGDHQDAAVAMAALRRMAASTGTAGGRNGFTFGPL